MFIFGLKILVEDALAEINSSSQDFLQFGVGPQAVCKSARIYLALFF